MPSTEPNRFTTEAATWDEKPAVLEGARLAFNTLSPIIHTLSEKKKSETGTQIGLNILEIGCGTGLLTLRVAPLVHQIVAIDPAEGMIEVLKKKKHASHSRQGNQNENSSDNIIPICHLLEDPESLSLPPASPTDPTGPRLKFDLILSHLVMHHVPDLHSFLSTILYCLEPGGRVALTDYEDFGPEAIMFHPPTKLQDVERHGINRKWIEGLMREVGFVDVSVEAGWTLTKPVEAWEGREKGETRGFPFLVCQGTRAVS
ncbi:S-adenosyl-L-methionine-dependent methyltransferase [Aspergillus crustosus]